MKQQQKNVYLITKHIKQKQHNDITIDYVRVSNDYWVNLSSAHQNNQFFFTTLSYFNNISHAQIQEGHINVYFEMKQEFENLTTQINQKAVNQSTQDKNCVRESINQILNSKKRFLELIDTLSQKLLISLKRVMEKKQELSKKIYLQIKQKTGLVIFGSFHPIKKTFSTQKIIISNKLLQLLNKQPRKQIVRILNQNKIQQFFTDQQYIQSNIKILKFVVSLVDLFVSNGEIVDIPDTLFYEGVRYLVYSKEKIIKCNIKYIYKHPGAIMIDINPIESIEKFEIAKNIINNGNIKIQCEEIQKEKIKDIQKITQGQKHHKGILTAKFRDFDAKKDKYIQILSTKKK